MIGGCGGADVVSYPTTIRCTPCSLHVVAHVTLKPDSTARLTTRGRPDRRCGPRAGYPSRRRQGRPRVRHRRDPGRAARATHYICPTWPGKARSTVIPRPLHPDQAVAELGSAVAGRGHHAPPVVGDLHRDLPVAIADRDLGACRASVLDHVGQRLLDDPVGRQVHPGGQRRRRPLHPQPHRQPGLGHLGQQAVQIRQAGHRRQGRPGTRRPGAAPPAAAAAR